MKDYSYLNEERIDGEDIFDGKVVHLIRDRVSLPNGHEGARGYPPRWCGLRYPDF